MTTRPCWSGVTSAAKAMNFRSTARSASPASTAAASRSAIASKPSRVQRPRQPSAMPTIPVSPSWARILAGRTMRPLSSSPCSWVPTKRVRCSAMGHQLLPVPGSPSPVPLRATVCHSPSMVNHSPPLRGRDRTTTPRAWPAAARPPIDGADPRSGEVAEEGGRGAASRATPTGVGHVLQIVERGRRQTEERHDRLGVPAAEGGALEPGRGAGCGAARCRPPCGRPPSPHPGPRPAKHTAADHARAHERAAVHLGRRRPARRARPPTPPPASGTPGRRRRARAASPAGTITSTHSTSPGTTSTAPPPLRRRTTSIPAAARRRGRRDHRAGRSRARGRARSASHTHTARSGGVRHRSSVEGRRPARGAARPASSRGQRGGVEVGLPVLRARCRPRRRPTSSRGARSGRRRSTIVVSWRSRSRLRTLQGRHAATTFSQVCSPPRLRGTTWSMLSAATPQYWQRWPSRANTPRRLSGRPAPERHLHEVAQPDHRRHREREVLGVQRLAGVVEDVGLVAEHEHGGSAAGHHAQRLVGGVEHEGPRHRRNVTGGARRATARVAATPGSRGTSGGR